MRIGCEKSEMTRISQFDAQVSEALERLRSAIAAREAAKADSADEAALREQVRALQEDNARLSREFEQLRAKRDKDVAALDELIAQLKPLIEEV
jgi:SMC interacting uncharacterized protein involved in chromosome segregation